MQIRCYRCGWSFAIKREEAAFALEALEESGGNHYDSRCPNCRHSNRISIEQLRAIVPRSEEPEVATDSEQENSDEAEVKEMPPESEEG